MLVRTTKSNNTQMNTFRKQSKISTAQRNKIGRDFSRTNQLFSDYAYLSIEQSEKCLKDARWLITITSNSHLKEIWNNNGFHSQKPYEYRRVRTRDLEESSTVAPKHIKICGAHIALDACNTHPPLLLIYLVGNTLT